MNIYCEFEIEIERRKKRKTVEIGEKIPLFHFIKLSYMYFSHQPHQKHDDHILPYISAKVEHFT